MKKIILLVLLSAMLLIVGCGEGEQQVSSGAFIGGSQGVTVQFEPFGVEESGTYSIYDEETFPIEVTLKNKGEYELQKGDVKIELKGPSLDFSGIPALSKNNEGIVEIISDLLPTGGEETITFATDAKYNQKVSNLVDREWFANIEYTYKTYLIIPEVCLKEDLKDDRVCEVEGAKTFSISGAPITVTAVEESTAGKGIMALRISVSNVGGGEVTKIGEDFGVQEKISYTIDSTDWECKQGGKLNEARLIDGTAEIICKLKTALPEGTLATKQLELNLDYKYRDIIQEKLRIKESAE